MQPTFRLALALLLFALPACDTPSEADAGLDATIPPDGWVKPDAYVPPTDAPLADVFFPGDVHADVDSIDGGSCSTGAIVQLTENLLFTSESDYPLDLTVVHGEGSSAPTPAQVLTFSGLPGTATVETATVDRFFSSVVVDPTVSPPVPAERPALLRAQVEADWQDLIVVRIADPANPAQIHMYLAGRNACDDLVWLHSISVET